MLIGLGSLRATPPELLPEWWAEQQIINSTANEVNMGIANLGQAKWITIGAIRALESRNASIASAIKEELKGNPQDPITPRPLILDFDAELAAVNTPERIQEHKAPLLLGQLKALVKPFYDRLNQIDPNWIQGQFDVNGLNAQNYWLVSGNNDYIEGGYYPWNPDTPVADNKVPATIGQLKAVFALRFESLLVQDIDKDELIDLIEIEYFGDTTRDGSGDFDGDGFSDRTELLRGTDPTSSLSNTGKPDIGLVISLSDPHETTILHPVGNHVTQWTNEVENANHALASGLSIRRIFTTNSSIPALLIDGGETLGFQSPVILNDAYTITLNFGLQSLDPNGEPVILMSGSDTNFGGRSFEVSVDNSRMLHCRVLKEDGEWIDIPSAGPLSNTPFLFSNHHSLVVSVSPDKIQCALNGLIYAEISDPGVMQMPNKLKIGDLASTGHLIVSQYNFYDKSIEGPSLQSLIGASYHDILDVVKLDSDFDRIGDRFEISLFGNLDRDLSSDEDGDGVGDFIQARRGYPVNFEISIVNP